MSFDRITAYQQQLKDLESVAYSPAFPKIARGHGSRSIKTPCVHPGCNGRGSVAHNQNPESAAKQWQKDNNA